MRKSHLIAGGVIAAALVIGTGVGAQAHSLLTGSDIKNGSITGADIATNSVGGGDITNGSLHVADLAPSSVKALKGQTGAKGASGINGTNGTDGKDGKDGKDGVTDLNAGAGYSHHWAGDNGEHLNTIVAKCDAGQVALSGGFSTWGGSDTNESGLAYDLGGDNKSIQVTVSAPYTGKAYDESKYHGGILPDRWVVKGYNTGSDDQIVRAWVVCANAS